MNLWKIVLAIIVGATLTAISLQLLSSDNFNLMILLLIVYSGLGYIYQPHLTGLLRFERRRKHG